MLRRFFAPSGSGAMALAAALVLAVAASTNAQIAVSGQAPPRDPAAVQETTGTGRIAVVVLAAETSSPVKRAHVMLHGMVPPVPHLRSPTGRLLHHRHGVQPVAADVRDGSA